MADGIIIDLCQNNFKCFLCFLLQKSVEVISVQNFRETLGDAEKMSSSSVFSKKTFRGLIEKRSLAGADPGDGG